LGTAIFGEPFLEFIIGNASDPTRDKIGEEVSADANLTCDAYDNCST
jgi:hypothetical protein